MHPSPVSRTLCAENGPGTRWPWPRCAGRDPRWTSTWTWRCVHIPTSCTNPRTDTAKWRGEWWCERISESVLVAIGISSYSYVFFLIYYIGTVSLIPCVLSLWNACGFRTMAWSRYNVMRMITWITMATKRFLWIFVRLLRKLLQMDRQMRWQISIFSFVC